MDTEDIETQPRKEFEELAPYLDAIGRPPVLTREEERALASRARMGDPTAKERMVRHNLALVIAIVRRYPHGGVRLDDLVQEGNIGLMRAVDKFDPRVGTRFSTYASWWIRAYVRKYLKTARSAVRPQSGAVAPSDLSLDASLGEAKEGASFLDRLEDQGPSTEDRALSSERDLRIRGSLARLRPRVGPLGWDIIHSRLKQDPPQSLARIGRRWGISRERVRQVETETKRFLGRYLQRLESTEGVRSSRPGAGVHATGVARVGR